MLSTFIETRSKPTKVKSTTFWASTMGKSLSICYLRKKSFHEDRGYSERRARKSSKKKGRENDKEL